MGWFNSISNTFKSVGSKIGSSINKIGTKAKNNLIDAGFNKNFNRDFKKGFGMVGKGLQAPQKYIDDNDPTGGVLGFGASLALAPITGIGYLEQMAVDDKLQNKLKSGDVDTIMNTTFSGISIIPMPGGGLLGKGAKTGYGAGKSIGRKLGQGITKAL